MTTGSQDSRKTLLQQRYTFKGESVMKQDSHTARRTQGRKGHHKCTIRQPELSKDSPQNIKFFEGVFLIWKIEN